MKIVLMDEMMLGCHGGDMPVIYEDLIKDGFEVREVAEEELADLQDFVQFVNHSRAMSRNSYENEGRLVLLKVIERPERELEHYWNKWLVEKERRNKEKEKNRKRAQKAKITKERNKIIKACKDLGLDEEETNKRLEEMGLIAEKENV